MTLTRADGGNTASGGGSGTAHILPPALVITSSLLRVADQCWHMCGIVEGATRMCSRQCLNPLKDEEGWSQIPWGDCCPDPLLCTESHCPSGTLLTSHTGVPGTSSPGSPSPPVWLAILAPSPACVLAPALWPGSLAGLLADQTLA